LFRKEKKGTRNGKSYSRNGPFPHKKGTEKKSQIVWLMGGKNKKKKRVIAKR